MCDSSTHAEHYSEVESVSLVSLIRTHDSTAWQKHLETDPCPWADMAPHCALANMTRIKRIPPAFVFKLDWSTDAPANKIKAEKAFLDAIIMARLVHMKAGGKDLWLQIFNKYFQPDNQDALERVFAYISGAKHTDPNDETSPWDDGNDTGSDDFARMSIVNTPFPPENTDCEANPTELAWLEPLPNSGALLRICPRGFKFPLRDETTCEDVGDKVSGKMSSLGGVILHEMTYVLSFRP